MYPEASTLTAVILVFGRCTSVVEDPTAPRQVKISEHVTSSRRDEKHFQMCCKSGSPCARTTLLIVNRKLWLSNHREEDLGYPITRRQGTPRHALCGSALQ